MLITSAHCLPFRLDVVCVAFARIGLTKPYFFYFFFFFFLFLINVFSTKSWNPIQLNVFPSRIYWLTSLRLVSMSANTGCRWKPVRTLIRSRRGIDVAFFFFFSGLHGIVDWIFGRVAFWRLILHLFVQYYILFLCFNRIVEWRNFIALFFFSLCFFFFCALGKMFLLHKETNCLFISIAVQKMGF
jgi:hypothetical protein